MSCIPIIAGSTRRDRQSIKVARFVLAWLQQRTGMTTELLNLLKYNFPILEERLHRRDDPPPGLQEFGDKIPRAGRTATFLDEVLWFTEAIATQKAKGQPS